MIDLGEIELSGDRPEPGSLACLRHILALLSDNKTPSLSRDGVRRGTTRVDAARVHSLRFYRCADRPVLLVFSSGSSGWIAPRTLVRGVYGRLLWQKILLRRSPSRTAGHMSVEHIYMSGTVVEVGQCPEQDDQRLAVSADPPSAAR